MTLPSSEEVIIRIIIDAKQANAEMGSLIRASFLARFGGEKEGAEDWW